MPLTAKKLTDLVTETIKARQSVDKILDFVDLMNNHVDEFSEEVMKSGQRIKEITPEIESLIENIKIQVNNELNKLPVDIDNARDAASKLILYHGDIFHVIHWAETQKSNYEVDSYWWRYWEEINKHIREQFEKGAAKAP